MSTVAVILAVAAALFAAFVGLSAVTLWLSVRKHRADRARARARERVRQELFERRERAEPDWEEWVASLSECERTELAALVKHYLRVVHGPGVYVPIAEALGMGADARSVVTREDADRFEKLRALSTLAAVDRPVPIEELRATCRETQRTREAGARLVWECNDSYERPARWGTELIVGDGQEPMTLYGLDTLRELNYGAKTPLLDIAQADSGAWTDAVFVQVCSVVERTRTTRDQPLDWLVPLLEHGRPECRAAAVRALRRQGWRTAIRRQVDLEELVADPSPHVRQAAYDVLTDWGDDEARDLLASRAIVESDTRCQLQLVRSLVTLGMTVPTDDAAWPETVPEWVHADLAPVRTGPTDGSGSA